MFGPLAPALCVGGKRWTLFRMNLEVSFAASFALISSSARCRLRTSSTTAWREEAEGAEGRDCSGGLEDIREHEGLTRGSGAAAAALHGRISAQRAVVGRVSRQRAHARRLCTSLPLRRRSPRQRLPRAPIIHPAQSLATA